jgi:hypothetical protein
VPRHILPIGLRLHRRRCCRDTEDEEVAPLGPLIAPVRIPLALWHAKRGNPARGLVFPNGDGQPINLTKFVERVIEPALEAKSVAFKTLYAGWRGFATILRKLTGASVAGRDALGHVSTATTEAHYEKPVPEAVLKGIRLLEGATTKR